MTAILSTIFDNMKIITTNRCHLEFLLNENDSQNLLLLKQFNLKNDYIKPLYIDFPNDVNKKVIEIMHNFRYKKNLEVFQTVDNIIPFQSLYYLVKLKDSKEIIGSLEMCNSINEKNCISFGLFIDQKYSRQGFGTETLMAGITFLKQYCNIEKLKWDCYKNNTRSINIAKKCGFRHAYNFIIERNIYVSTFYLDMLHISI